MLAKHFKCDGIVLDFQIFRESHPADNVTLKKPVKHFILCVYHCSICINNVFALAIIIIIIL